MTASAPASNHLISCLSHRDRGWLLRSGETVTLSVGQVLCEPGQAFPYAYFPLTAGISLVTTLTDHPPLELGLIGSEGMLGATLVLGLAAAPHLAVAHDAGSALRIRAAKLRRHLRNAPSLLNVLQRYQYVLLIQLSTSAACARFHAVEVRLARRLLMAHDRAGSDQFELTHAGLASMLGVRRSGITVEAGTLQQKKLIRYARGTVSVLDRAGLEAACCECYATTIRDYARVLAQPP